MGAKGTWYYLVDGQQQGPLTMEQLYSMASSGHIKGDTKVWCEGWSHWVTYAEYTQSKELQNTAQIAAKKAKGGKGLMLTLIIGGSLILVGGVVLMIVLLAGGSGSRGFDSPRALVEELTSALNDRSASRIKAVFPTKEELDPLFEACPTGQVPDWMYDDIQKELGKIDREIEDFPSDFSVELKSFKVKEREVIEGQVDEACILNGPVEFAKVRVKWVFFAEGNRDTEKETMKLWKIPGKGWFLIDP